MIGIRLTRMYLLREYSLVVLMHTTAWDRLWGGDEILKWVSIYITWLHLAWYCNVRSLASPQLMDPRGLRVTQTTYVSLLTHPSNFHQWLFVIRLEGLNKKGSLTDVTDKWTYRRTDRREVWNIYLDDKESRLNNPSVL